MFIYPASRTTYTAWPTGHVHVQRDPRCVQDNPVPAVVRHLLTLFQAHDDVRCARSHQSEVKDKCIFSRNGRLVPSGQTSPPARAISEDEMRLFEVVRPSDASSRLFTSHRLQCTNFARHAVREPCNPVRQCALRGSSPPFFRGGKMTPASQEYEHGATPRASSSKLRSRYRYARPVSPPRSLPA